MIEEPWAAGGLAGTLARPAQGPPRGPAALIIAGSGPTDRDGNGPNISTDTYRLIAAGLASAGIRSLRYDKRGIGGSMGAMTRETDLRFDHLVDDALGAARHLSARPDVSSLVLAGHSEGGLIATLAAEKIPAAGLVLLASPGRPLAAVLRRQLQAAPMPQDLRERALDILGKLSVGEEVADVPPVLAPLFRASVQPYLMSQLAIDPAAALARLAVPTLIVLAGRDIQIVEADLAALTRVRRDARVLELPYANHTLKRAPANRAGNVAVYQDRAAPLDPDLMPALVEFVREVAS